MITPALITELDRSTLGFRLRFLSGGMSDEARTTQRSVLPERCAYYIGAKMVKPGIAANVLDWAVRASANEIFASARRLWRLHSLAFENSLLFVG